MGMDGPRFTVLEIAQALGVSKTYVGYRVKRLGLRRTEDGYAYEDVKKIASYKRQTCRRSSPKRTELLRKKLADDGKI